MGIISLRLSLIHLVLFVALSLSSYAQLSGNKTVGNGGDYPSLKAAFDDINSVGLNGTLKLEVISDISMPSSTQAVLNAWTIHGGINDSVIVYAKTGPWTISGSIDYDAIVKLMNTTNVRFDGDASKTKTNNLIFKNLADNGNSVFSLNGTNVTCISHCVFQNGGSTSGTYCIKTSTMGNDYLSFDNCVFQSSNYGIYAEGKPVGQSGNLKVKDCVFGDDIDLKSIATIGIYSNHYTNIDISGNEVKNLKSDLAAVYGFKLENSSNVMVLRNNIHDVIYSGTFGLSAAGIYLSNQFSDASFVVQNNVVNRVGGRGWNTGTAPCGIYLTTGATAISKNVDIQFNTINLSADANWGVYSTIKPLLNVTSVWMQGSIAGVNLNNNVFNTQLGARIGSTSPTYGYAVYCMTSGVNPFKNISNNIYYVNNHTNNFIGYNNGSNLNLASWFTFTGDANSVEADPLFVSSSDVNLQTCSPAYLNGMSVGGVSNDLQNNSRHILPTIGAIENIQQAKDLNFTNVTDTSFTANWTNGNISKRIVFVSQGNTGAPILNQGVTYSANSKFMLGSNIGAWYCVYNGSASSVNVSGLTQNTQYRVVVYEYNNTPGKEVYYMLPANNNPQNVLTDFPAAVGQLNEMSVSVYPNPANDVVMVKGNFSLVEIVNLNGQIIRSVWNENEASVVINTSDLSKGIYFVKVQNENIVHMQKLIVE